MVLTNPDLVRRLIGLRGYTPASFARLINTSPATLHRILAGTRRASPAMAHRIAHALDIGIAELFSVTVTV